MFDFEFELIHQIKQYERGVVVHYKWRQIDDVAINDVTFSQKPIWRMHIKYALFHLIGVYSR